MLKLCRHELSLSSNSIPKSSLDGMAGVCKGVGGGARLQLSQLATQVWWEEVGAGGCPLTPLDEGRPGPFKGPHHQV